MVLLTGADIWQVVLMQHPLIEGLLWEGDVMMLLGSEKAGKSILGLQLACCLSSGTPFLDKYKIPVPVPVLYIQTEGKEAEMVEARMRPMSRTIPLNETYFSRVFQHFLPLDDGPTVGALMDAMTKILVPPKVIVIDSLYTSMQGDLNENQAVRTFITAVSQLLRLGTTLIIIHHETKEQWEAGRLIDRGDKGSYGSVFLRAWVSHILYLKKHKDKSRTLSCDTQRSGQVLEREELVLIEPDPLCFQIRGSFPPATEAVIKHLSMTKGLTRDQLVECSGLSMRSVAYALSQLLGMQKVIRTSGYPRVYTLHTPDGGR